MMNTQYAPREFRLGELLRYRPVTGSKREKTAIVVDPMPQHCGVQWRVYCKVLDKGRCVKKWIPTDWEVKGA